MRPELALAAIVLIAGLFALIFDRNVANAMNSLSIALTQTLEQLWPQWKTPKGLAPWSRERFRNWLWFVRVFSVFFILMGLLLLFGA
jgi:hypothetical protein